MRNVKRIHRIVVSIVFLAVPAAVLGDEDDARALAAAKEALDRGAALFDKRDAAAMAATFDDNAVIALIKQKSDPAGVEIEAKRGRAEIEQAYADIFKDRSPEHKARNTVESATFLNADMLLIRGRFALNADDGDVIRFVQLRSRQGDQWKVVTMQLVELPK